MAQLIVTIVGASTGPYAGGLSAPVNLSDDDAERLLTYIVESYGVDEAGEPREPQAAIGAAVAGIAAGLFGNVVRHEQEAAAQAARDAVQPIPFTLGDAP